MDARRRYVIKDTLGQGGFGTVYRAERLGEGGFSKVVALKVLNAESGGTEEFAQRLRDEARMLGRLRHRAIVQVDELVRLDGRWAVVMELVEGTDLKRLIRKARVPLSCTLEMGHEVASALHAAYARPTSSGKSMRLLHRDIKPANIQLTSAGEVKVLDFGIARADFDEREAQTQSMRFGSIPYMSPERLDFEDGHAGDVYALGAVLFELITRCPLGKTSPVRRRHEENRKWALERLEGCCDDPDVIALIDRTLAYRPGDRPTAQELASELRSLQLRHPEPSLMTFAEETVPGLVRRPKPEGNPDRTFDEELSLPVASAVSEGQEGTTTPYDTPEPRPARGERRHARVRLDAQEPARERPRPSGDEAATLSRRTTGSLAVAGWMFALGGVALALVSASAAVGLGLWIWHAQGTGQVAVGQDEASRVAHPELGDVLDDPSEDAPGEVAVLDEEADEDAPSAEVTEQPPLPPPARSDEEVPQAASEAEPCGAMPALEDAARQGALGASQLSCIDGQMRSSDLRQTERERYGRLRLVHDVFNCEQHGACSDYERTQTFFFEHISRSDPDLLYAWTDHLYAHKPLDAEWAPEIQRWAERALERRDAWRGPVHVERVNRLHEIRAKVIYADWSRDSEDERRRLEARQAALDWMAYRMQLGRDPSEARELCASVEGTATRICARGADEEPASVAVTLVSVPLGAEVFVEGRRLGTAPLTEELAAGEYRVRMEYGDHSSETRVRVGRNEPLRHVWRSTEDRWEQAY